MQEVTYAVRERAKFKLTEADRFHRVHTEAGTNTQLRIFGPEAAHRTKDESDKPNSQPFFAKGGLKDSGLFGAHQSFFKTVKIRGSAAADMARALELSPRSRRQHDLRSQVSQLLGGGKQDLRCFSSRMLCPSAKAGLLSAPEPVGCVSLTNLDEGENGFKRREDASGAASQPSLGRFSSPRADLRAASRSSIGHQYASRDPLLKKGLLSRKSVTSTAKKIMGSEGFTMEGRFRERGGMTLIAPSSPPRAKAPFVASKRCVAGRKSAPTTRPIKA